MVRCWGPEQYVWDATYDVSVLQPPKLPFTSVSMGRYGACGLRPNGRMICWGVDDADWLFRVSPRRGDATGPVEEPIPDPAPSPVPAVPEPGSVGFTAVSAGFDHTCGLRPGGSVECWGWIHSYYDEPLEWEPSRYGLPDQGSFAQVSAGAMHECALGTDGAAECWGFDHDLIFGSVEVAALRYGRATPPEGTFKSLSAGYYHTCGVKADATVECWGYNHNFRGSKHFGQATPPEGEFLSVSAGHYHTCGVTTDADAVCWGSNYSEDYARSRDFFLWDSDNRDGVPRVLEDDYYSGQANPPEGKFQSVSAGSFHTCGVKTDGSVACWGSNSAGQSTPPDGAFRSVSAGRGHSCGLATDGAVRCWRGFEHNRSYPVNPAFEVARDHPGDPVFEPAIPFRSSQCRGAAQLRVAPRRSSVTAGALNSITRLSPRKTFSLPTTMPASSVTCAASIRQQRRYAGIPMVTAPTSHPRAISSPSTLVGPQPAEFRPTVRQPVGMTNSWCLGYLMEYSNPSAQRTATPAESKATGAVVCWGISPPVIF